MRSSQIQIHAWITVEQLSEGDIGKSDSGIRFFREWLSIDIKKSF